jgi:hypothetical protein
MLLILRHDFISRAAERQQHVWFIVRYSNGAVGPDEVSSWPISKMMAGVKHLGYWLDRENANSKTT